MKFEELKETLKEMPGCVFNKILLSIIVAVICLILSIIFAILSKSITCLLFGFLLVLINVYIAYRHYCSYVDGDIQKNEFVVERLDLQTQVGGKNVFGFKVNKCKVVLSCEINDQVFTVNTRGPLQQLEKLEVGDKVEVIFDKNSLLQIEDFEFTLLDFYSIRTLY